MVGQSAGKVDCFGAARAHARHAVGLDRFLIADLGSARHPTAAPSPANNVSEPSRLQSPSRLKTGNQRPAKLLAVVRGVGERQIAAHSSHIVQAAIARVLQDRGSPLQRIETASSTRVFEAFAGLLARCRQAMSAETAAQRPPSQLAAVVTLVYIAWPKAFGMHLGNSRAYHWRQNRLHQITNDHTMATRLVQAGALSRRRADQSTLRNVVWKVVGTQGVHPTPELFELDLAWGDGILLGTDGFCSATTDPQIQEALQAAGTAEETCQWLSRRLHKSAQFHDAAVVIAKCTNHAVGRVRATAATQQV